MCSKNRRDVDELSLHIKEGLTFFFVDHYKEVFQFVFKKACKLDTIPKNVIQVPKGSVKDDDEEDKGDVKDVAEAKKVTQKGGGKAAPSLSKKPGKKPSCKKESE